MGAPRLTHNREHATYKAATSIEMDLKADTELLTVHSIGLSKLC